MDQEIADFQDRLQKLGSKGVSDAQTHPTQVDLARLQAEEPSTGLSAMNDPEDLAVHALLHRAWALELERKGWNVAVELSSIHIKALRVMQAGLQLIPKREPIT